MIGNSATAWGPVSRFLHWVAAALIVVLVAHGGWMTEFASRDARIAHYAWHASVGHALLALMFVRLFWRLGNAVPALPPAPAWERATAVAGHWGLYAAHVVVAIWHFVVRKDSVMQRMLRAAPQP